MGGSVVLYCAGPIRGQTNHAGAYRAVIRHVSAGKLAKAAGDASAEGTEGAKSAPETAFRLEARAELRVLDFTDSVASSAPELSDAEIHDRDCRWIGESDGVVAEVSGPSLGVGYEIAYALYDLKIPVLAVALEGERVSAMIAGCSNPRFEFKRYSDEAHLLKMVDEFAARLFAQRGNRVDDRNV